MYADEEKRKNGCEHITDNRKYRDVCARTANDLRVRRRFVSEFNGKREWVD